MALPATAVGEVRTTGSDTQCAGFFNSARGGTDYSQQDTAQATGTVTVSGTTCTATTGIFTSQMVGNYITDGTSYREITAFTSSTVVTLDATVAWTGATIYVGGALATPSKALGVGVSQNIIYVKTGSYGMSANPTVNASAATPASGATNTYNRIIGYNATRGDNPTGASRPTITASGTCTTMLALNGGWIVEYLILDCGTTIASVGISFSSNYNQVRNCWIKNFKQYGVNLPINAGQLVRSCEVSGGTSAATAGINVGGTGGCKVFECYIHDNACPGVVSIQENVFIGNLICSNTGASSDGIQTKWGCSIRSNTIYGNGRDGIRITDANGNISSNIKNNIVAGSGGYGLNFAAGSFVVDSAWDGNAYYNNTSGTRNNCGTGTTDVLLSAGNDPFTNAASGDFSLNTTANRGALLRAAGIPGVFPGGLTTGYLDIGAVQHQDAGGGGGTTIYMMGEG